ncbi:hypothetical protein LXL04_032098 [Taraxacum kok-saghyz]
MYGAHTEVTGGLGIEKELTITRPVTVFEMIGIRLNLKDNTHGNQQEIRSYGGRTVKSNNDLNGTKHYLRYSPSEKWRKEMLFRFGQHLIWAEYHLSFSCLPASLVSLFILEARVMELKLLRRGCHFLAAFVSILKIRIQSNDDIVHNFSAIVSFYVKIAKVDEIMVGPFDSDSRIKATNGSFKDVRLALQDVRCEETVSKGQKSKFTKVAAVIRVVSPFEDHYSAGQRTGLNNMTLSAEGIWESSSGQLCMIGCIGIVDRTGTGMECDSRTILEKHEPFSFQTVIKKSFLTFPKVEDADSYLVGLSLLSEDLTLHHPAFPDSKPISRTDVQFEILSLGPLFGHYWSLQNESVTEEDTPYHAKPSYTKMGSLILGTGGDERGITPSI